MIDIKLVRENPDLVKENLKKRFKEESVKLVDEVLKLDKKWRGLKFDEDKLRSERNAVSKKISELKKAKKNANAELKKAKKIPEEIEKIQEKRKRLQFEIRDILLGLPNFLDKKVPSGKDETENVEVRKWGKKPKIENVKSHAELGEALDILDLKRGVKLAGSGFYLFKNELAQMQRALIQLMLDFHREKGKTEVVTPILANAETAEGTAHLPKFDEDMYKTREGFYLIPTAEMTLTNLHRGENLTEDELSKRYYGYTPCFRTEVGRHGVETGIFRVHQFDKVEMVTICNPKDADKELKIMMDDAEELLKKLEIPYRVLLICSGDLGLKETITYDLETWSPHMKKYMETSSVSKCGDYQARRMNTRYQDKKENELKFVETLNGSALALPRLIIAILENNQQKDGSIRIPKVLWPYMAGVKVIKPKESKN